MRCFGLLVATTRKCFRVRGGIVVALWREESGWRQAVVTSLIGLLIGRVSTNKRPAKIWRECATTPLYPAQFFRCSGLAARDGVVQRMGTRNLALAVSVLGPMFGRQRPHQVAGRAPPITRAGRRSVSVGA